jgi:hypothetical protein
MHVPWGQRKVKKQMNEKHPGDKCLLGLSFHRLSFPILPISFDVAGYEGGLDVAGVGVHGGDVLPLSPCHSSFS